MRNENVIRAKKCSAVVLATVLSVGVLIGCGKKEESTATAEPVNEVVEEVKETEDAVEETAAEEAVEETTEEENENPPFLANLEKYDSIISGLTSEQYYSFAAVGEDYDVLLVADGVFDNGDGNMAAIDAKVYGFGNDGKIYEAGNVWSDGTAYPIAVFDDKYLMFGGNHHMTMANVIDGSVVIQKEASEEFDEQGNATYSYNEGNIDDIREVEDDSILKEMYENYANAVVLNFFPDEAAVVGDEGAGDYPSNDLEERVNKTSFESYDEIIGLLEGDEAYALVKVKGYDGDVLLVTSYTYDDLLGHIATTELTPYTMKDDGQVTADSAIFSGGTATPIAMDKDGVMFAVTHTSVDKYCYGDNGTPRRGLMALAAVYAEDIDDNGNPKTVGGFVRQNNSLIDDDSVFLEGNEVDIWKEMLEEYEKAEPISFTKASK